MPTHDISPKFNTPLNYPLNDHRIEKIIRAHSLNEASQMGLLDSILDRFFHNEVKKTTITTLYQQLAIPDESNLYEYHPIKIASRFNTLRTMAAEEYQSHFNIDVFRDEKNDNQWSYALNIENTLFYQSKPLDYHYNNHFNTFCALKYVMNFNNDFYQYREEITLDKFIQRRISCLSDETRVREYLAQHLDDDRYSRYNFVASTINPGDKNQLLVKFQDDVLVVSNRASSRHEFRGRILQEVLETASFNNLRELLSNGHMTQKDEALLMLAVSSKRDLMDMIGNEIHSDEVRTVAYNTKVGNTTLGALWNLTPPSSPHSDIFSVL